MAQGEEFSVPREIIFQILKDLPVKSLLRLRCVSKLWCSVIDDPFFVHSHQIHSHTRPGGISILLSHNRWDHIQLYSVGPEGGPDIVHLVKLPSLLTHLIYDSPDTLQSVNGLVCIQNCIWNPSTRQRIAIPPWKMSITVESEPQHNKLKFVSKYMLGFDPSSDKYKILNKYVLNTRRGYEAEGVRVGYKILTIGTDSWREIDYVQHKLCPNERSCCIAGVIYFFGNHLGEDVILAFELKNEKFRIIPLPGCDRVYYNLVEVGERLAVIDDDVTKLWILEDYEKLLWKRESFIFPDHYEGRSLMDENSLRIHFQPIGTIHTGEILLISNQKSLGPKLFYYDLESKTLRMVDELSSLPREVLEDGLYTKHVETLFR